MVTNWDIYWITRLDDLRESLITTSDSIFFLLFVSLLGAIAIGLTIAAYHDFQHEDFEEKVQTLFRKITKPVIVGYIIILLIGMVGTFAKPFIPTTKQMVAIYALPPAINNEEVQQLPENILKFVNKQLREWAEETTEEN